MMKCMRSASRWTAYLAKRTSTNTEMCLEARFGHAESNNSLLTSCVHTRQDEVEDSDFGVLLLLSFGVSAL